MEKKTAYIALGSNLAVPALQIKTAIEHIKKIAQTILINTSPFYENPPMGPQDQDDFVNAVVEIKTTLDVKSLLHALQAIEEKMGRIRIKRWGPRIIDLDLLLYENLVFQDFELTLPHPGVFDRIFFLQPLHDLTPDLCLPDGRHIVNLFKPALTAISNKIHG